MTNAYLLLRLRDLIRATRGARNALAGERDWRAMYQPGLPGSVCNPLGVWFRACEAAAPRERLLTAASWRSCMSNVVDQGSASSRRLPC